MVTITEQAADPLPLSDRLRELSRDDHRRAETTPILRDLLTGTLPRERYAAMIGQLFLVYSALEDTSAALVDDPAAGPFVTEALLRREALAEDLTVLEGAARLEPPAALPATAAYCARIRETREWPGGFVAHHYTRYLGDLSGGQFIGRVVAKTYGLTERAGLSFYAFPAIVDLDAFKDGYRRRLDDAPWPDEEQQRIGDEVLAAYAHNVALLDDVYRSAE